MKKYRLITTVLFLCLAIVIQSLPAFAWSNSSTRTLANGEKLKANIWMGTGATYSATSSAYLLNQQEPFSSFTNTMTLTAYGIGVSIGYPPSFSGSSTSCSKTVSSATIYAGISESGFDYDVGLLGILLYIKGKSRAGVQHVGQEYGHTVSVKKFF